MDIIFILNKIFDIESELQLFDHSIENEYYWRQLRSRVFDCVVKQNNLFERAHEERKSSKLSTLNLGIRSSMNMIFKNPIFAKNKDILFHGHDRRIKQKDGVWWDLFCDPIIDNLTHSYLIWEGYNVDRHLTPPKTKKIYYLDFPAIYATIISKFKYKKIAFSSEDLELIEKIQTRLKNELNCSMDIQTQVKRIIVKKKTLGQIMLKMIKKINPKIVFVVVGYGLGSELVIEACKKLQIPVVELQHGTLSPYLLEYTYPSEIHFTNNFPDYFFTFGEYWNSMCSLPIPKEHIISVGYPFFESQIAAAYKEFPSKLDQIIFISQGPIGKQFSKIASDFSKIENLRFKIIYKLHPGEFKRWRGEYPWLLSDKITVIENQFSIHQLFAQSKIQVGVYSMAIYEGIAFGLDTVIVNLPGVEYIESLIKSLNLQLISNAQELKTTIDSLSSSEKIDPGFLFKKDSISNIMQKIDEIIVKHKKV